MDGDEETWGGDTTDTESGVPEDTETPGHQGLDEAAIPGTHTDAVPQDIPDSNQHLLEASPASAAPNAGQRPVAASRRATDAFPGAAQPTHAGAPVDVSPQVGAARAGASGHRADKLNPAGTGDASQGTAGTAVSATGAGTLSAAAAAGGKLGAASGVAGALGKVAGDATNRVRDTAGDTATTPTPFDDFADGGNSPGSEETVADTLKGTVKAGADAVAGAAAGAAQGAKFGAAGAAVGGAAGAAKGLTKSSQGRKLMVGAVILFMVPVLAVHAMLTSLTAMLAGENSPSSVAGTAAELSGISSDSTDTYKVAVRATQTPWYMLAAIDFADDAEQEENPYQIVEGDRKDLRGGGAALAVQLQELIWKAEPGFLPSSWALVTGTEYESPDWGATDEFKVPEGDADAEETHQYVMEVWQDAVAQLPIKDAETRALPIVENAFKLATGQLLPGCGSPSGWQTNPTSVNVAEGTWVNPAEGRVSSPFGMRFHPVRKVYKLHTGADVAAPLGTPIYAAANGVVTVTGGHPSCGDSACGSVIEIDHGNGVTTRYLHMAKSDHLVVKGDQVSAGQQIGKVNTMGFSTGAHLHFEVLVNGAFVNPTTFLAERGAQYGTGPVGAASQVGSIVDAGVVAAAAPGSDPTAAASGDTVAEPLKGVGITGPMSLKKANGQAVTITEEMQRNASVVIGTIKAQNWPDVTDTEKDRLTIMALITMAQESMFYTHPTAQRPDGNGDVGPFQQRSLVGWYADGKSQAENVTILNDISYATRTFIEGHPVGVAAKGGAGALGYVVPGVFQKKNWRTGEPWEVVASVQVPAAQYRHLYSEWQPIAVALLASVEGTVVSTMGGSNLFGCGALMGNSQFSTSGDLSLVEPGPWGGHQNGAVPSSELCEALADGRRVKLRCDAAKSLEVLFTEFKRFGSDYGGTLAVGQFFNGYQSTSELAECKSFNKQDCGTAHGWGLAVDFETTGPAFKWLVDTQGASSWKQPEATKVSNPGHFEFYAVPGPEATGWAAGLKPATINTGRYIEATYPEIETIGGHRTGGTPDHPSGRAIDVMIPDYSSAAGIALGDKMAADLRGRATELGLQYIIWRQHIWSVKRDAEGWRLMEERDGVSANHMDHLHVNTW